MTTLTVPVVNPSSLPDHPLSPPSASQLRHLIAECAYDAFKAGWCAGSIRRTTKPASQETIEDIAAMLDTAVWADTLTRPK